MNARVWGFVLALGALMWGFAGPAAAADDPPPVQIVGVEIGWSDDSVVADRWQPARVLITSDQRAFTGLLSASHVQTAGQSVRMAVAPVSSTPGVVTAVELPLLLPRACDRIDFELTDGKFTTKMTCLTRPGADELWLPKIRTVPLVVVVGRSSAGEAFEPLFDLRPKPDADMFPAPSADPATPNVWEIIRFTSAAADRLPMSWAAYESADLLIVDEESLVRADPRSRAALVRWVRSGGRLALRLSAGSAAWPAVLAMDEPPLEAAPPRRLGAEGDVWGLDEASTTVIARALRLTAAGKRAGWKIGIPTADAQVDEEGAPVMEAEHASGFTAYGPVGLGMVAIVGLDPAAAPNTQTPAVARLFWRAALLPVMPPNALQSANQTSGGFAWGVTEPDAAVNDVLDALAEAPPVGAGVFIAIVLCMVVLILMIGPFDALVLRRMRLAQHSWKTALMWIGIACVVALIAPRVVRSGITSFGRFSVIDSFCGPDGRPVYTAEMGLDGVFAGRTISLPLKQTRAGSWARSVSFSQYWNQRSGMLMPDMPLMLSTDDADGPVRAAWPGQVNVPQWTYRTLADTSPLAESLPSDIGATVRVTPGAAEGTGDEWMVTMVNMPAGATVKSVAVRTASDAWRALSPAPTDDAGRMCFSTAAAATNVAPIRFGRVVQDLGYQTSAGPMSLAWVREREQAIVARLAEGRNVCVYAEVGGLPADVATESGADVRLRRTAILRLLVPVETNP